MPEVRDKSDCSLHHAVTPFVTQVCVLSHLIFGITDSRARKVHKIIIINTISFVINNHVLDFI